MERVVAVTILVSGMVLFMALARCLSPRLQRAVRQVVFAVYLLGNLYVTLLSRRPEPVAHLEMELFSAYRNSFELDYGILGTIKRLLTEGFPAGIRLVTTEPLEGVILNILLYLPMGFLLPLIMPKLRIGRVVMIGFLASLLTETVQLVFHLGWFDVDDLINNTLGTLIGFILFALFMRRSHGSRRV